MFERVRACSLSLFLSLMLYACKGTHTLFTGQREKEREGDREREKEGGEREKEREGDRERKKGRERDM